MKYETRFALFIPFIILISRVVSYKLEFLFQSDLFYSVLSTMQQVRGSMLKYAVPDFNSLVNGQRATKLHDMNAINLETS